ncbi:formylglycine-generating enzyme family protein [Marinomonas sp. 15G1-11]|uniref:Formylglycine-generating enzyme family protein n=1 Tax=Marinomonas phaeophyticola TaxID=3004091 RepID=A0ABT4JQ04_9GAMM|nr:formylglycine-generating enzyme family protein [Marinomonas sp. 15G1-11]MCZ2720458.1 formylglycine-generating enzyme family protein [Marinomonas sp. 15G1-11]
MNQFFDPNKLTIGVKVGLELEPYTLNYPLGNTKNTWVADQGGRPFVLRFYDPKRGSSDDFLVNARKYLNLKHPSITPNYPPFYSSLWVYNLSAVCGGEKLYSYLGKYPEGAPLNVVISIFEGIAKALDQSHKSNLFHGTLDLNHIHVVNGVGVMIAFGHNNWLTSITEDDADLRFIAPESKTAQRKINASTDSYSFMRILLASLLGESKVSSDGRIDLPSSHSTISDKDWKTICNWCRTPVKQRPKNLIDVIRLLRANLYQVTANKNIDRKPVKKKFTIIKKHKLALIGVSSFFFISTILAFVFNAPDEEAFPQTQAPLQAAKNSAQQTPEDEFKLLPNTLQDELQNGDKAPEVTKIQPSTFEMGDRQNVGDDNEKPVHTVIVPTGFYISSYEVTFDHYDLFAKSTNRPLPSDNGWGRGKRPVINVSWYDAKAYTQWLTEQTNENYRLPTEIEWEYSIRAGSGSSFWYGDKVSSGYSVCDGCGSIWDGKSTAPVGSLLSNPLGLFDMHGNVAEWVEDCYHDDYIGAPTSNTAWNDESCDSRVIRGGSWFDIPRVGRSSTRYRADPNLKASNWGFRVTRVIKSDATL